MEILIGGLFITMEPKPDYVDVMCVGRVDMDKLAPLIRERLNNLLNNKRYIHYNRISVAEIRSTPKSKESDEALYDKAIKLFRFDKKHNPTIFRVCLQEKRLWNTW